MRAKYFWTLIIALFLAACGQEPSAETMNETEDWAAENSIWLAQNARNDGITVTASGLQYEILAQGSGEASPGPTDTVVAHYAGSLINGKEFDSSYKRNQPLELPLNRVIKGWTEGLQLMKPGDKFKFYIPSNLGYGSRGAGADIPPDSTLIFVVELLEIKPS